VIVPRRSYARRSLGCPAARVAEGTSSDALAASAVALCGDRLQQLQSVVPRRSNATIDLPRA
jgi:hypothetical protein